MAEKKITSCLTCRHKKALDKMDTPCIHCHNGKKWQKRTKSQNTRDQRRIAAQEYYDSKKKNVTIVEAKS